jgi:hypothetical protein
MARKVAKKQQAEPTAEREPKSNRRKKSKSDKSQVETPKASDVRVELCEEQLKCQLTDDELDKIADRSAHLTGEIENKRGEMKAAQSSQASEIKSLEAQLSSLAAKRRDRCEYRMIECERVFDYRNNEVRVVRLDTKETVRRRAMTGSEREMELRLEDGRTVKEAAGQSEPEKDEFGNSVEEETSDDGPGVEY